MLGAAVVDGCGFAVGSGVGVSVGSGIGVAVGAGVPLGTGVKVGRGVAEAVGVGAIVGSIALVVHLSAYFLPADIVQDFPITFAFTYFFSLIGGVMLIIGISDYLGRGQYRRRIRELEQRRSQLRERMYEVFVSN